MAAASVQPVPGGKSPSIYNITTEEKKTFPFRERRIGNHTKFRILFHFVTVLFGAELLDPDPAIIKQR
jgi:hypothetical protein